MYKTYQRLYKNNTINNNTINNNKINNKNNKNNNNKNKNFINMEFNRFYRLNLMRKDEIDYIINLNINKDNNYQYILSKLKADLLKREEQYNKNYHKIQNTFLEWKKYIVDNINFIKIQEEKEVLYNKAYDNFDTYYKRYINFKKRINYRDFYWCGILQDLDIYKCINF